MPPSTPRADTVDRWWYERLAVDWTYGINYVAQTLN